MIFVMILIRTLTLAAAVALTAFGSNSVARAVPFVAAFQPLNSAVQPYSGIMHLDFNRGTISGTYDDTSIQPRGPLVDRRLVHVSGGVDEHGSLTLLIGPLTVHGTMHGRWMSGTATFRGRLYAFKAREGLPGKPVEHR